MIVQCERCGTRFHLDDPRIYERDLKVKCSKCLHTFIVPAVPSGATERPVQESGPEPAESKAARETGAEPAERGTLQSGEAETTAALPETGTEKAPPEEEGSSTGLIFLPGSRHEVERPSAEEAPGMEDKIPESPAPEEKPEEAPSETIPFASEEKALSETDSVDAGDEKPAAPAPVPPAGEGGFDLTFDEEPVTDDEESEIHGKEPEGTDFSLEPGEEKAPEGPVIDLPTGAPEVAEEETGPAEAADREGEEEGPEQGPEEETKEFSLDALSEGPEQDETPHEASENPPEALRLEPDEIRELSAPPGERGRRGLVILALILSFAAGAAIYYVGHISGALRNLAEKRTPVASAFDIEQIGGYYLVNRDLGRVFVIKARIRNRSERPERIGGVRGKVYGASGTVMAFHTVPAGSVLSDEDIKRLNRQGLERLYRRLSTSEIPAGGTVPVVIVFSDLPGAVSEYAVDVLRP